MAIFIDIIRSKKWHEPFVAASGYPLWKASITSTAQSWSSALRGNSPILKRTAIVRRLLIGFDWQQLFFAFLCVQELARLFLSHLAGNGSFSRFAFLFFGFVLRLGC